jgi:tRNA 5-methylaminomethyl-2-thiouridine biosynthesis bifunctional protein
LTLRAQHLSLAARGDILALKPASLQWSEDGSFESAAYGDVYFQRKYGIAESDYVFLQGNNLETRFTEMTTPCFRVAELGFGSGLNFLQTLRLFVQNAPQNARLFYTSIEKHPVSRDDLKKIYAMLGEFQPWTEEIIDQYPPMLEGFHHLHFMNGRIRLMLCFGDVMDVLPNIHGYFDAWYLDGFSPAKNPDMWQDSIFPAIGARTAAGGTLATFSVARRVLNGLENAGFDWEKIKGFGIKWHMTRARFRDAAIKTPAAKRIAVLGAGIAGCAAAHALAARGHDVHLYDRTDGVAQETSGNPAAVLYPKLTADPSPRSDYHTHAFLYARGMARHMQVPSLNLCGVRHIGDDERHRAMTEKNAWPEEFTRFDNGLLHDMAGMVDPRALCHALADHPRITPHFSTSFDAPPEGYDETVIALGHASRDMEALAWLPLQCLRGQVTLLTATAASENMDHVICHDGYITPAVDGLHCIGATFQKEKPDGFDTRAEDDAENLRKLNDVLPQLGFSTENIAGSRAGFRAATPDRMPIVGACPDYAACIDTFAAMRGGAEVQAATPRIDNMYVSTGFGAHGMTGALLAAEIIAADISDEPLPVPGSLLQYLMPERFIFRALKRRLI